MDSYGVGLDHRRDDVLYEIYDATIARLWGPESQGMDRYGWTGSVGASSGHWDISRYVHGNMPGDCGLEGSPNFLLHRFFSGPCWGLSHIHFRFV
jgi:hypothetical protein